MYSSIAGYQFIIWNFRKRLYHKLGIVFFLSSAYDTQTNSTDLATLKNKSYYDQATYIFSINIKERKRFLFLYHKVVKYIKCF